MLNVYFVEGGLKRTNIAAPQPPLILTKPQSAWRGEMETLRGVKSK